MFRSFWGWFRRQSRSSSGRRSSGGRGTNRRPLVLEMLESRDLPSVTFFQPDYMILNQSGSATPQATAGPTGYTPAQIKQAYGFNQISFDNGTIPGDGRGTTIAIVDAYDSPTIASDLHQFDLAFGLPDPTFTRVNQSGGSTLPAANASWSSEISLDVEYGACDRPSSEHPSRGSERQLGHQPVRGGALCRGAARRRGRLHELWRTGGCQRDEPRQHVHHSRGPHGGDVRRLIG